MDYVYLIWDNSRAEHGEGPLLACIYGQQESAENHVDRERESACEWVEEFEEWDANPPFYYEKRMVIG